MTTTICALLALVTLLWPVVSHGAEPASMKAQPLQHMYGPRTDPFGVPMLPFLTSGTLDISKADDPNIVGRWSAGPSWTVAVQNTTAFYGNGGYLEIADISNPATPTMVTTVLMPEIVQDVAVRGDFAYVASNGLRILDISNLPAVTEVGYCCVGYVWGVTVNGNYAYTRDHWGNMSIIDISDPSIPSRISTFSTDGVTRQITVKNDVAYIASWSGGIYIVDVSTPSHPTLIGRFDLEPDAFGIDIQNEYAFVGASHDGFIVLDVSNPAEPDSVATINTEGSADLVFVRGDYAYVSCSSRGLYIIDITDPRDPQIAGRLDVEDPVHDLVIAGDFAYTAEGDDGMRIISILHPSSPTTVGSCDSGGNSSNVAVAGNYAYVAQFGKELQILDISQPHIPIVVGTYDAGDRIIDISVDGERAYITDSDLDLLTVLDIANPSAPSFLGSFEIQWPGSAWSVEVHDGIAYVTTYHDGLWLIDVSNPAAAVILATYDTSGEARDVTVDDGHAYVRDGPGGVVILDVSSPTEPEFLANIATESFVLATAIDGERLIIGESGAQLRVFDITNPTAPVLEGEWLSPYGLLDVCIGDDYAFAAGYDGVHVVDIANGPEYSRVAFYETGHHPSKLIIDEYNLIVLDAYDGLWLLQPRFIGDTGVISLNYGDDMTIERTVVLNSTVDGATRMRFRNNDGVWGDDWLPYDTEHEWMLSPGYGPKRVYAEFRDPFLNSLSLSSEIALECGQMLPGMPTAEVGNDHTVRFDLENSANLHSATIVYRVGGSNIYANSAILTDNGSGVWSGTIPGGYLTKTGVQLYVDTYDGANHVLLPFEALLGDVFSLAVEVEFDHGVSYETVAERYFLLASPIVPDEVDPEIVFDQLGDYDERRWRYFTSWDENDRRYAELQDPTNTTELQHPVPGQGFWLITRDDQDIPLRGVSTPLDKPCRISIRHGWNMIGNPFAFSVDFTHASTESDAIIGSGLGIEWPRGWLATTGKYETGTTVLDEGRGYWIYNNGEDDVLLIPPVGYSAGKETSEFEIDDEVFTCVRLEARIGTRADCYNHCGLRPGATSAKDRFDYMDTPPSPGGELSLSLLSENGQHLLSDYRSSSVEGTSWTLLLTSNRINEEFELTVTIERPLPEGWLLHAVSTDELVITDLTNSGTLTGRVHSTAFARTWFLVAGPADYVSDHQQVVEAEFGETVTSFSLEPAFPNPFASTVGTVVTLAVPKATRAAVRIYNVRGRVVRELHDGNISRGRRRFVWYGRDDNGRRVASGIYIVRAESPETAVVEKVILVR